MGKRPGRAPAAPAPTAYRPPPVRCETCGAPGQGAVCRYCRTATGQRRVPRRPATSGTACAEFVPMSVCGTPMIGVEERLDDPAVASSWIPYLVGDPGPIGLGRVWR